MSHSPSKLPPRGATATGAWSQRARGLVGGPDLLGLGRGPSLVGTAVVLTARGRKKAKRAR